MTARCAEALLELDAPRSAAALLHASPSHGIEINRLRARADRLALRHVVQQRVHALGVTDGLGVAIPLTAARGPVQTPAERLALEACNHHLQRADLPSLTIILPDALRLDGQSAGLPLALAFLARYTGRAVAAPVFASAELLPDGRLLPVGGTREKIEAALRELDESPGLILVHPENLPAQPHTSIRPVTTLAEAAELVLPGDLSVDPNLLTFSSLLREVSEQSDPRTAVALLQGFDASRLPAADHVHYLFECGIQLRHAGDAASASRLHAQAREVLDSVADILGPAQVETLEIEALATAIDQFSFVELEADLRQRLERAFQLRHNAIRCRGMLAQLLATTDRLPEAVSLREENLEEQQLSEAMLAEIPRTLCHLLRDVARLGDDVKFDSYAGQVSSHGEAQSRYNDWALVFGLVKLGRAQAALAWIESGDSWLGLRAATSTRELLGGGLITSHPDVSTARVLVRALRQVGRIDAAFALARRIQAPKEGAPLVAWLAHLGAVEGILAEVQQRGKGDPKRLATLHAHLMTSYPPAARHYRELVDLLTSAHPSISQLEKAIDAVYY